MKAQRVGVSLFLLLVLFFGVELKAQQRMASDAVNIEFEIPDRFMKISEDKKATVY